MSFESPAGWGAGKTVKNTDSWAQPQTYWIYLWDWFLGLCALTSSSYNFYARKSLKMTAQDIIGFKSRTISYSWLGCSLRVLQCLTPRLVHRVLNIHADLHVIFTWTYGIVLYNLKGLFHARLYLINMSQIEMVIVHTELIRTPLVSGYRNTTLTGLNKTKEIF